MSLRFAIKRWDRLPKLRLAAKSNVDGSPVDFTGATARFLMADESGTLKVDYPAIVEDPPTDGIVQYDWQSGDTDTAGEYRAEFELDFGGPEKLTLPTAGYILVKIYEDLNNE